MGGGGEMGQGFSLPTIVHWGLRSTPSYCTPTKNRHAGTGNWPLCLLGQRPEKQALLPFSPELQRKTGTALLCPLARPSSSSQSGHQRAPLRRARWAARPVPEANPTVLAPLWPAGASRPLLLRPWGFSWWRVPGGNGLLRGKVERSLLA